MERRRAARVQTTVLVAIEGIDERLVVRQGNISASGLFVELDGPPSHTGSPGPLGAVGTVQWLRLSSFDTARSVGVMAHVVRTLLLEDRARGTSYGVALEFMPESDAAARALQEFVLYVLARKLSSTAISAARRPTPPPRPAAETAGGIRGIELETAWPIVEGETLELTLRSTRSGKWIRCHAYVGPVSRIAGPDATAFRSRLRLEEITSLTSLTPPDGDSAPLSEQQLGEWMSRYVVAPDTRQRDAHGFFEGLLSRIKLPTLLSLVEMDRMTGKLVLHTSHPSHASSAHTVKETVTLALRDGRVLDATSTRGGAPRDVLRRALAWNDGVFEFRGGDVEGPDRLATTTTALMLDLIREDDEARRPVVE